MSAQKEAARPPKDRRVEVLAMDRDDLVYLPVTETENQRNAGQSIVQELEMKGWIKPDADSEHALQTPNGIKFRMVRPKSEVEAETKRNNERAKKMEGFGDHNMVKKSDKKEETYVGQELMDQMGIGQDHNG